MFFLRHEGWLLTLKLPNGVDVVPCVRGHGDDGHLIVPRCVIIMAIIKSSWLVIVSRVRRK